MGYFDGFLIFSIFCLSNTAVAVVATLRHGRELRRGGGVGWDVIQQGRKSTVIARSGTCQSV